jgi:hypothetical protein
MVLPANPRRATGGELGGVAGNRIDRKHGAVHGDLFWLPLEDKTKNGPRLPHGGAEKNENGQPRPRADSGGFSAVASHPANAAVHYGAPA